MDEMLDRILTELVPAVDTYNQQLQQGIAPLHLSVSNNNANIPISFIKHQTTKDKVADMYKRGHPHQLTGAAANIDDVRNLSKFLQTCCWYPCPNNPKCRKSHVVHRPDLAVIYREPAAAIPLNAIPYRVPIFITEVEGMKAGWGRYEQEAKALEEAVSTLAFMPDTFLLFVYHNRFEFWYLERNSDDGCIDVTSYPIYIQVGGKHLSVQP